jgi:fatty-acyl-CoA synthase
MTRDTSPISGRIDDMIIRGGENIYPREIEELLQTHPKITQAYVIGVPDHHYGEQVCGGSRSATARPSRPTR